MNRLAKKILVVDNSPIILKYVSTVLTRAGHAVTCAEDALSCIDILVELTPDIIFLDLIMPGIEGDDLCRIIRNIENLQHCYIAILSATALEGEQDFTAFGADACIAKGPLQQMAAKIFEIIEKSEYPRLLHAIPEIDGAEHLHFRQITKELLDSNHHLKVILEGISQGILELKNRRITYANPKALDLLSLNRERLLGQDMAKALPKQLSSAIGETNPAAGQPATIRLSEFQVVVEQFALDEENRIVLLSDITERKKMEAVIEAANLTKNLGYVFSGIRHEIGNPLNSIKMALTILQRNLGEYDMTTIAEFIDRSLQEVARLEYLLKALKNYSLFERPDMQPIPVADFISGFAALIRNDFEHLKIRIQTIIKEDHMMILADSRALHHIFLNLITNAADALTGCEHPRIIISAANNGQRVDIKIDDNGKGISEQNLQHLFQPFFTSKTTGTGLGLVIVKKMLSAMNGSIALESYPDLGTTVTLSLAKPPLN